MRISSVSRTLPWLLLTCASITHPACASDASAEDQMQAKIVQAVQDRMLSLPGCQFAYTHTTDPDPVDGTSTGRRMEFILWRGKVSFREVDRSGKDLLQWTFDGDKYYGWFKPNATVYLGSDARRTGQHLVPRFHENPLYRMFSSLAVDHDQPYNFPNLRTVPFWAGVLVKTRIRTPLDPSAPVLTTINNDKTARFETRFSGPDLQPDRIATVSTATGQVVEERRVARWETFLSPAGREFKLPAEIQTLSEKGKVTGRIQLVPGSFQFLDAEPPAETFRISPARAPKLHDDDLNPR